MVVVYCRVTSSHGRLGNTFLMAATVARKEGPILSLFLLSVPRRDLRMVRNGSDSSLRNSPTCKQDTRLNDLSLHPALGIQKQRLLSLSCTPTYPIRVFKIGTKIWGPCPITVSPHS